MFKRKRATIAIVCLGLGVPIASLADDSQLPPIPPHDESTSTATSTTSSTSSTTSGPAQNGATQTDASSTTSVAPASPVGAAGSSTPVANAPADPNALLYAENVAPGPFEAKRKLLLASIKAAKKQGFGITVYLGEFAKIEDQVKQGQAGPQLEDRIDSIADGLQDQLKRSQVLKTQRPGPAVAGHSSSPAGGHTGGGGGGGGGKADDMIAKLRAKYGDRIPAGLDPAMLNSPAARDLLNKFRNGQ